MRRHGGPVLVGRVDLPSHDEEHCVDDGDAFREGGEVREGGDYVGEELGERVGVAAGDRGVEEGGDRGVARAYELVHGEALG